MKILIVDDNEVNIKVICGLLKDRGHTFVTSHNGVDAIEIFKKEKPNLILMDIVMPEMNGRQSAYEIKKLSGNVYIPIIFVTALKAETDMVKALESGGDDYITKPFDRNILYSKIKAHERILSLNTELETKNNYLIEYNTQIKREQDLVGRFFDWGQEMCDIDPDYIKFYTSPASAYNGDIFLVKRRPSGGLYVLVGDFTGHGLTAAIGTLPVTDIFFRLTEKNASIVDIVREINIKLYQILPVEIFFAATLIEIDHYARSLSVWSGGIPESYMVNKASNEITTITCDHMPLGVMEDSDFDSKIKTYHVEEGMKLYCSTDGLIESSNEDGELFGEQRLQKVLTEKNNDMLNAILSTVDEFTGKTKQNDDITIVEVTLKALKDVDFVPGAEAMRLTNVLPFTLDFKIELSDMRKESSLIQIADMLGGNAELRPHKTYLYTIITELYVNALEHGVLGLDSHDKFDPAAFDEYYKNKTETLKNIVKATISIKLFMPDSCDKVVISVSHSGKGGEFKNYNDSETEEKLYGRGLDIVKSLCCEFEYQDYGRLVIATYRV